jgi:hypothetical protein
MRDDLRAPKANIPGVAGGQRLEPFVHSSVVRHVERYELAPLAEWALREGQRLEADAELDDATVEPHSAETVREIAT